MPETDDAPAWIDTRLSRAELAADWADRREMERARREWIEARAERRRGRAA